MTRARGRRRKQVLTCFRACHQSYHASKRATKASTLRKASKIIRKKRLKVHTNRNEIKSRPMHFSSCMIRGSSKKNSRALQNEFQTRHDSLGRTHPQQAISSNSNPRQRATATDRPTGCISETYPLSISTTPPAGDDYT